MGSLPMELLVPFRQLKALNLSGNHLDNALLLILKPVTSLEVSYDVLSHADTWIKSWRKYIYYRLVYGVVSRLNHIAFLFFSFFYNFLYYLYSIFDDFPSHFSIYLFSHLLKIEGSWLFEFLYKNIVVYTYTFFIECENKNCLIGYFIDSIKVLPCL